MIANRFFRRNARLAECYAVRETQSFTDDSILSST